MLQHHLVLVTIESDTGACSACTSRAPRSVDVRLGVLGRLHLDYQVDRGNIKTSRGYISCYKHLELFFFESLECHFSLVLGDVTVHDLNLVLYFFGE